MTLSFLMSQKNPLSHKITFFVVATFPPTTFVYFLRFLSCYSLLHQVSLAYHVTLLLLNSVHIQSVPTTVTNLITIQSWIRACFEKNVILKTSKNFFAFLCIHPRFLFTIILSNCCHNQNFEKKISSPFLYFLYFSKNQRINSI